MTSNQIAAQANKISERKLAQDRELELSKQRETAAHNRAMEHYTGEEIKAGVVKAGVGALTNVATSFIKSGNGGSSTNTSQNQTGSSQKNKSKPDYKSHKSKTDKSKNDLSWTARFPELNKALGSLPQSVPYGNSNALKGYSLPHTASNSISIPAVAVMKYTPVLGKTDTDVIELVSAQMYTWLRSVNSGSKNYERSDLILYLMGGSQIVSLFAFIAKLIGLSNTFERDNKISGEVILRSVLQSMGLNPNQARDFVADVRNKKLNYISKLNVLAKRFNSFFLPAVFPVIQRWMWMAGFVGKDQETTNYTTYYVTVPTLSYEFTTEDPLEGVDTSGKLKPIILREFYTLDGLLSILEDAIQSFFIYEDMAIIAGDIHKAFGDTDANYIRIDSLNDDVYIIPYCSREDMVEFMNANFVGDLVNDTGEDYYIYQNEVTHSLQQEGKYSDMFGANHAGFNGLLFKPELPGLAGNTVAKTITDHNIVINDTGVGTTPDHLIKYTNLQCDRAEALRWDVDAEEYFVLIEQFKTEIMNTFEIYMYSSPTDAVSWVLTLHDYVTSDEPEIYHENYKIFPYFKWIPVMRIAASASIDASGFISATYITQPLFKHFYVPHETWTNIATVSLMSLYGFDVFGTAYRYQGKYDVKR